MKPILLTAHATAQCADRGATGEEVKEAIERGTREPVKRGRFTGRLNFQYGVEWQGRFYAIKQVAPVAAEEQNEVEASLPTVILENVSAVPAAG